MKPVLAARVDQKTLQEDIISREWSSCVEVLFGQLPRQQIIEATMTWQPTALAICVVQRYVF